MNTKNNQRYKRSNQKIEKAFLSLIQNKDYESINISQICKQANINRSTFYCHYDDINDLIIKIESKFAKNMATIFQYGERQTHQAFVDMFQFIKENNNFYKAFLKIPYSTLAESNIKTTILENISDKYKHKMPPQLNIYYRANFFGAGIKEMCKIWLQRECKETPEQMATLLLEEYTNRT